MYLLHNDGFKDSLKLEMFMCFREELALNQNF